MSFMDFFHLFMGFGIGLLIGFWIGFFTKGSDLFWKS